ncbi:MAG: hypothetical protein HQK49_17420 [Oligoflexia bacterium]|nr:hypothetical protein [Oligoflexia bacterium]
MKFKNLKIQNRKILIIVFLLCFSPLSLSLTDNEVITTLIDIASKNALTSPKDYYSWQPKDRATNIITKGIAPSVFKNKFVSPNRFAGDGLYASENFWDSSGFATGDSKDDTKLLKIKMSIGTPFLDLKNPTIIADLASRGISVNDVYTLNPPILISYPHEKKDVQWNIIKNLDKKHYAIEEFSANEVNYKFIKNNFIKIEPGIAKEKMADYIQQIENSNPSLRGPSKRVCFLSKTDESIDKISEQMKLVVCRLKKDHFYVDETGKCRSICSDNEKDISRCIENKRDKIVCYASRNGKIHYYYHEKPSTEMSFDVLAKEGIYLFTPNNNGSTGNICDPAIINKINEPNLPFGIYDDKYSIPFNLDANRILSHEEEKNLQNHIKKIDSENDMFEVLVMNQNGTLTIEKISGKENALKFAKEKNKFFLNLDEILARNYKDHSGVSYKNQIKNFYTQIGIPVESITTNGPENVEDLKEKLFLFIKSSTLKNSSKKIKLYNDPAISGTYLNPDLLQVTIKVDNQIQMLKANEIIRRVPMRFNNVTYLDGAGEEKLLSDNKKTNTSTLRIDGQQFTVKVEKPTTGLDSNPINENEKIKILTKEHLSDKPENINFDSISVDWNNPKEGNKNFFEHMNDFFPKLAQLSQEGNTYAMKEQSTPHKKDGDIDTIYSHSLNVANETFLNMSKLHIKANDYAKHGINNLSRVMQLMIYLHDLGKPIQGTSKQKASTKPIIDKTLKKLILAGKINEKESNLIKTLINNDVIGDSIKNDFKVENTKNKLIDLAKESGLPLKEYFMLQKSFYLADATYYPIIASQFNIGADGLHEPKKPSTLANWKTLNQQIYQDQGNNT